MRTAARENGDVATGNERGSGDDLVVFLRARLAEDVRAAIATLKPEVVVGSHRGKPIPRWAVHGSGRGLIDEGGGTVRAKDIFPAEAEHVVRHDPARVLREIEAKRRIVDAYAEALRIQDGFRETTGEMMRRTAIEMACLAYAVAYADHPDHREEWKP